jgi:hypothetical protein
MSLDHLRKAAPSLFSLPEDIFGVSKEAEEAHKNCPTIWAYLGPQPSDSLDSLKLLPALLYRDENTNEASGLFLNKFLLQVISFKLYS